MTTHGERALQRLFNDNYSPIGPTGTELFWARILLIFQIGDNIRILFKLLQKLLCLWFLPAKWSVLQPLVTPVVGSSQPLCKKLSIFWQFSIFRSFLLGFRHNYRAFMVLILITHVCGEDPFVLSSLSPIVPSSSDELCWSSLAICLVFLCSVVHCLTLILLLARHLCTYFLWTFLVCTRHVTRLWYMCLSVG